MDAVQWYRALDVRLSEWLYEQLCLSAIPFHYVAKFTHPELVETQIYITVQFLCLILNYCYLESTHLPWHNVLCTWSTFTMRYIYIIYNIRYQRSGYDKGRFWPNLRNCLHRYNIKHNHWKVRHFFFFMISLCPLFSNVNGGGCN